MEINLPKGVKLTRVDDKSLSDMLAAGEIDCALVARPPDCFIRGHPDVARLFPNYLEMEEQYAHEGVADHACDRGEEADPRPISVGGRQPLQPSSPPRTAARVPSSRSRYPIPGSRLTRRVRDMFGGDLFPFGIEANRPTLSSSCAMCRAGIAHRHAKVEDIFPHGVMVDVHT